MEEKYTFTNVNLELIADYRYYDEESHLWISFQSCSPYKTMFSLEYLDGTEFKKTYTELILKFCRGMHFTYNICCPASPIAKNTVDIKVAKDTNIDLEGFTNNVNSLLKVQYQYLSKQNLIKRKASNSTSLVESINSDVIKRGVSGFDPELVRFVQFELQTDEYDLEWIKIPTNVRAVQLTPNSILIYFGRYARVDRTSVDGVSYVELTYDEADGELRMLRDKQAKTAIPKKSSTKKTSSKKTSKSKKSDKEVDHDN